MVPAAGSAGIVPAGSVAGIVPAASSATAVGVVWVAAGAGGRQASRLNKHKMLSVQTKK